MDTFWIGFIDKGDFKDVFALDGVPHEYPNHHFCRLIAGSLPEKRTYFAASSKVWTREDYWNQWADGLRRLIFGESNKSLMMNTLTEPTHILNNSWFWGLWRQDDFVYIRRFMRSYEDLGLTGHYMLSYEAFYAAQPGFDPVQFAKPIGMKGVVSFAAVERFYNEHMR